ncbi:hypothetical protein CGRA01v4_11025 [Colletotrichum graminicola]|nr:hypothetical protein CGRA01v4_11025 [Colletotrichum graminicola]
MQRLSGTIVHRFEDRDKRGETRLELVFWRVPRAPPSIMRMPGGQSMSADSRNLMLKELPLDRRHKTLAAVFRVYSQPERAVGSGELRMHRTNRGEVTSLVSLTDRRSALARLQRCLTPRSFGQREAHSGLLVSSCRGRLSSYVCGNGDRMWRNDNGRLPQPLASSLETLQGARGSSSRTDDATGEEAGKRQQQTGRQLDGCVGRETRLSSLREHEEKRDHLTGAGPPFSVNEEDPHTDVGKNKKRKETHGLCWRKKGGGKEAHWEEEVL